MKHKAQESFERIYQQDYEVFDSSCLVAVEDSDMMYEEDCDTIQELIDCQLTVEEIETIERHIKCAIEYKEYLASDENYLFKNSTKREIVKMKQMISKLHKQKEMWVSENE